MTRRKRKMKRPVYLALPVKIQALAEVFSGASLSNTARKYGVSPQSISRWRTHGFKWQKDGKPANTITINGKSTDKSIRPVNVHNYNVKRYTSKPKVTNHLPISVPTWGMKITSFGLSLTDGTKVTLTSKDLEGISKINETLKDIDYGNS